jgi:uncharacterized protein
MKILVFADLHDDRPCFEVLKEKSKQADFILGAGDYTLFGKHLKQILNDLNSLGKPCFLIHGNHEDEKDMDLLIKEFDNIQFVHMQKATYKGINITGYGGDGFSRVDKNAEKYFNTVDVKGGIILFHGPPFNINQDFIYGNHVGSESYRKIIEKQKPLIVVCGHIHETFGTTDKIGETIIINPGPLGVILDV